MVRAKGDPFSVRLTRDPRYAPTVPSVGVCNVPITTKMSILGLLGKKQGLDITPARAELDTLGLTHLSVHRGFSIDGEDVWYQVMEKTLAHLRREQHPSWDTDIIASLGMLPNYYLQYSHYAQRKLASQNASPPSRAEGVVEIEKGLMAQNAEPNRVELPEGLMNRGGIQPIPADPLPASCFGLVAQVEAFELLTVEAAVHGDRDTACHALLAHPQVPCADKIGVVPADLIETNRAYLPQFAP